MYLTTQMTLRLRLWERVRAKTYRRGSTNKLVRIKGGQCPLCRSNVTSANAQQEDTKAGKTMLKGIAVVGVGAVITRVAMFCADAVDWVSPL